MFKMNFPSSLTREEENLKKKYVLLKKKKRQLAQVRLAAKMDNNKKANPEKPKPKAAATATEEAIKLLKQGTIKVIDNKKQIFKRSRRTMESTEPKVEYEPYDKSKANQPKQLYESFMPSSKRFHEGDTRDRKRTIPDRAGPPSKGHTIKIKGQRLTDDIINDFFSAHGHIVYVKIDDEQGCAYVTYQKIECAQLAIDQMNNTLLMSEKIEVTVARNQVALPSNVIKHSEEGKGGKSEWGCIAANLSTESTSEHRDDTRKQVVYDDYY